MHTCYDGTQYPAQPVDMYRKYNKSVNYYSFTTLSRTKPTIKIK